MKDLGFFFIKNP